jgi:ComF family protein
MGKHQKILSAYKFGKRLSLGNFFAEKIRQGVELFFLPKNEPALVPVPARPGKIKKTGWAQIEYLAKLLEAGNSAKLNKPIPVIRCLRRLPSISQKKLNKEDRLQNLKGRIIINKSTRKSSQSIPKTAIIFDDVYTTGSTMDACAAALKSGGAEKVYGICLCYD